MTEHGIILAAGRGSRMGTLTEEKPKCLVTLAGKSLLEWQLSALTTAGIPLPITVVCGYARDRLSDARIVKIANERWETTNMVRSLLAARQQLEETACVVSYSDIVYHPDAITALQRATASVAITYDRKWELLWRRRFADPLSDAETFRIDAKGTLLEIGKRAKTLGEIQGQYMGLLRFTPAGWKSVSGILGGFPATVQDKMDMTTLLGHLLAAGSVIEAVPVDGRWCEIDSASDLKAQQDLIAAGKPWEHDWRF